MRVSQSTPAVRAPRILVAALAALVAVVWLAAAGTAQAALQFDLEQCRNGTVADSEGCAGAAWQNGNLNAQQAHYREGDSVPFRAVITDVPLGSHTLAIGYDTTEGGKHAYDYLTSFDRTEDADPCSGLGCDTGSPTSTKAIPTDPTLADAAPPVSQVAGSISAWGATIGTVSYSALPAGPEGQSNQVTVRIAFTATSSTVVFAWGGHVASQIDWGAGDAAGAISGSPFHMRLVTFDDDKVGNRERSMQAGAILPPATVATAASAATVAVGGSVTDVATLTGSSGAVTGSVVFFVCGPSASAPSCASGGTSLGSVAIANGRATSPAFAPTAAGAYCFRAEYVPSASSPYSPAVHTNLTTECFTATAEPDVSVIKAAEEPAVSAGQGAAFGIVVANTGTGTATGVTVNDPLPAGVNWGISPAVQGCSIVDGELQCALGSLAAGDSITIRVAGATTAAACGVLTNTATVGAGNEAQGKGANNTSTATMRVDCPDLTVRKEADNGTLSAGDAAGYAMVVTNAGAGTAAGVTLTDDLPAGVDWSISPAVQGCDIVNGRLECALGSLGPGQSATVHVTGATDAPDCGLLTNTVAVGAANEPAAAATDNSATATIAVNCAAIGLAKVADAEVVTAGDPIGFTITASNPGAGMATGVTISDPLPATPGTAWTIDGGTGQGLCQIQGGILTCDFGALVGGASQSVHLSSPTTEASCSTVDNVASMTTLNSGSAQAADQVAVECSSLQVAKTADAAAVPAGGPVGFTMTVRNTGAGTARGVTLTDPLPAAAGIAWAIAPAAAGCAVQGGSLDCAFGELAPGESRSVHVASPTTADSCAAYANTARGASGTTTLTASAQTTVVCGPNVEVIVQQVREVLGESVTPPAQPQGSAGETPGAVVRRARLVVAKSAPARARAGAQMVYVIRVTNRGRAAADNVVIRDRMPAGMAVTRRPAGIVFRSGELTWRLGDLRTGRSRIVRVRVRIQSDAVGRRCNVARASAANAAIVRDRACTLVVRRAVRGVVRPPVTG